MSRSKSYLAPLLFDSKDSSRKQAEDDAISDIIKLGKPLEKKKKSKTCAPVSSK